MRGLKDEPTAHMIIDGFRIYYNFIKSHQTLNGKTPAEVAGLDLNLGENKWLSLIKQSVQDKEAQKVTIEKTLTIKSR